MSLLYHVAPKREHRILIGVKIKKRILSAAEVEC
jgi:hypothetical protein